MAEVALEHVSKAFATRKNSSVRAVTDFSLTVRQGEFVVLLGPSGAGKTTLLRLIAGLEEITNGTISLDGHILNKVPPADRDIAMVFQSPALYPHMNVRENIGFPLRLREVAKPEIAEQVEAVAKTLALRDLLDRMPNTLSGGERQRVALGRALIRKPKIFLFDEPLSNLDPTSRSELRAEILRLHQQLSATMIYVTHDQFEAMTMADRIVVMKEGAIQQIGKPMQLYDSPVNLFVARFIGSPPMNLLHGTIIEREQGLAFDAESKDMTLALPKEMRALLSPFRNHPVVLGLRPEDLALAEDAGEPTSIPATVERVELTGPDALVHVIAGSVDLILRVGSGSNPRSGQQIRIAPRLEKAHFFDPASEKRIE